MKKKINLRNLQLETGRLILRAWQESDAEALYKYASDPSIGPAAGWPVHQSVEESRDIIRNVLSAPYTYAVVLKETNEPIGSVSLRIGQSAHLDDLPDTQGEIGYWIGRPYWGHGLIPEAVQMLLAFGFIQFQLDVILAGFFEGNERSERVLEKCGFSYAFTEQNVPCAIPGILHTEHYYYIERADWQEQHAR